MKIKSRKHHKEIEVTDAGDFYCPKLKNRPRMNVLMCLARQGRRFKGCVTCRIPQKIARKMDISAGAPPARAGLSSSFTPPSRSRREIQDPTVGLGNA